MLLFNLPLDLVSRILDSLQPYDFESLALTCHGTYRLLAPLLARHNVYRKAWHKVTFGDPLPPICSPTKQSSRSIEPTQLRTTRQLLVQIAQDPECVRYIRDLDLLDHDYPPTPEYATDDDTAASTSGDQTPLALDRLIRGLAAMFPTLDHLNPELLHWQDNLRLDEEPSDGAPLLPTLFLLSILPNLHTFTLSDRGEEFDVQLATIDTRPDARGAGQPDTLRPAKAEPFHFDAECGINMMFLLPFLALPSMRHVHFVGGMLDDTNEDIWSCFRPIGAQLETLNFDCCCISDEASALLFRDMKTLRVLKLGYESKHWNLMQYECQGVVDRVAEAARKTLEVLTLTASWNWSDDVGQPLRCLRRFERLRELELNTGVLYADECDENNEVDLDADYEYSCAFYKPDYESDGDDDDDDDDDDDEGEGDMDQDDANNRDDNDDASSEQEVKRFYLDDSEARLAKTCQSLDQLLSRKSLGTLEKLTVHVRAKEADLLCLKRLLRNLHGVGVGGSVSGGEEQRNNTCEVGGEDTDVDMTSDEDESDGVDDDGDDDDDDYERDSDQSEDDEMDSEEEEADNSERGDGKDNGNSKSTGNSRGGSNTVCPRLTTLTVCLYNRNRESDPRNQAGPANIIRLAQEYLGVIPGCKVGIVPYDLHFDISKAAWHASVARGEVVDEAERNRN